MLDVDGCVSTGRTLEETRSNIAAALAFHLRGMREDGDPIPEPAVTVDDVEVEVPAPVAAG